MSCGLHDLPARSFNGKCWYCRKAELELLRELEAEVYGRKRQEMVKVCALLTRYARKRIPDSSDPISYFSEPWREDESLMTFERIGQEMGITAQGAQFLFQSGLRKLRRFHARECRELQGLSEERQRCLPKEKIV